MKNQLDLIRRHENDVSLILMLVAGCVGAGSQMLLPALHGGERWNLAWNLAYHGAFANPFLTLDTGPTASNPPLAPLITAGLIRLFRVPFLIYLSSAFLSIMANAISAALLPKLSRFFFTDVVPGVFAALLWMFMMQVIPGWDTNYTATGLIYFACLTASIFVKEQKCHHLYALLAGVVAGLLCLLNPASMLVSLPWLLFIFRQSGKGRRQVAITCAIIVAIMFVIVTGWCARNARAVGAFALRTGMGLSLYVANNDCAEPTLMQEQVNGCYRKFHPNSNIREAEVFRRLGEVEYDRVRTAEAKAWIRAHPARFAELTISRFIDFWFPRVDLVPSGLVLPDEFGIPDYVKRWNDRERRIVYAIWVATSLSLFGFALMIRERRPVVLFVVLSMAIYPLMYYVTITEVRFRDPVLWVSLLPAGYFLCALIEGRIFARGKARFGARDEASTQASD